MYLKKSIDCQNLIYDMKTKSYKDCEIATQMLWINESPEQSACTSSNKIIKIISIELEIIKTVSDENSGHFTKTWAYVTFH